MQWAVFIVKWIHLFSISAIIGGTGFAFLILPLKIPEENSEVTSMIKQQWKRFGIALGFFWLLAIATGICNVYFLIHSVSQMYMIFLGMKIALALIALIISMSIGHRMPFFKSASENRRGWLLLTLVILIVILGISAKLNLSRINGAWLAQPTYVQGVNAPVPTQAP
jgi:putative copper export protein